MKSFACFRPRDSFKNWSKELDKRLAVWAKHFDSSFKLLLLGPAGAGKTTILKQMKIIHYQGFTEEERKQKAREIRSNLLESVKELTNSITASGHQITWHDKENQARLDFINGLNLDDQSNQTYDLYATKIYDYSKRILTDKGVEELFTKLNQLSITHRSQYLLNRVDEIRNVNYIPSDDDILQSRRRTSDIQKLEFQVKLPIKSCSTILQTFSMYDVGGQRGERRKWIQVFDGVSAVMFLIDSSSFDAIDEENGKNKLRETITLFSEVWTTRFLLNSNFVLLFNKQDILREKIQRGHKIEDHFPEYRLYKCPSQTNRSMINKSSEKLNLFRSSSSRSARASSVATSASRSTCSASANLADLDPSPAPSPSATRISGLTNRPSLAGYLTHSKSLCRQASSSNSNQNSPHSSTRTNVTTSAPLSTFATRNSSNNDTCAASDRHSPTHPTAASGQEEYQLNPDQAYIRARSFIRDKFLQITRQGDHERRKFSTSNLVYHNRGSVDQPKRNVCYHYTTATDTENIRDLFENLQKMVIKSTMKDLRR